MNFPKTLTAATIGVLSIPAACAADVEIYGVVDYGMVYNHQKVDISVDYGSGRRGNTLRDECFTMDSGVNSASRFGLRGSEDLGNGLQVGFKLENGFSSDTGELGENRLFGREAAVSVSGSFGTVHMGRMGTLVSDTGSVGFYGAMASAFGSGWSENIAGHTAVTAAYASRLDNVIAYVSPTFAGTTVYAQYAMGGDGGVGTENKTTADRYAAFGAKWAGGPFEIGALVDWTNKSTRAMMNDDAIVDYRIKDAYTVNLAGSYDCGFAKTFLAVQYFRDASDAAGILSAVADYAVDLGVASDEEAEDSRRLVSVDGFALHLSTRFDALGGTLKAGVGYMDGDVNDNEIAWSGWSGGTGGGRSDIRAWTAAAGCEYALSKRTTLYAGLGWVDREIEFPMGDDRATFETKACDVTAGLVHRF